MTAEQMWADFTAAYGIKDTDYDAWAFGADADILAHLVLAGVKTATSSALPGYALEGEPLPSAGEYSVILNGRDEAVCVIQTERVSIAPYREIGAEHARLEGEGDMSLEYWRQAHEAFFAQELAAMGLVFTPDMPVVCEEFRLVWPKESRDINVD